MGYGHMQTGYIIIHYNLAQYSKKPSATHFEVVKYLYRNWNATKDEGIYSWRKELRNDQPDRRDPKLRKDNNYDEKSIETR